MPQSAYHLSHMFPSTSRNEETEISPQHNPAASQSDHGSSNSVNYGSSPEETFNDEVIYLLAMIRNYNSALIF